MPNRECVDAPEFASPRRRTHWDVTREACGEEPAGASPWTNAWTPKGQDSRYGKFTDMGRASILKNLTKPEVRAAAKAAV